MMKDATDENIVRASNEWEMLRREIYRHAVHFTTGLRFDFRELTSHGMRLEVIGRLMWKLIKPFCPDYLIGPGFGAAPLLSAIVVAAAREGASVKTLMVRDQRKDHNRRRWIEGQRPPAGARAVLVDDFMESGSAVSVIDTALIEEGLSIDIRAAAILFDMWQPLGSRQLSLHRFPVMSLFKRHDIGLTRDCFDARPPLMKGEFPPFVSEPLWERYELNIRRPNAEKSSPVIAEGRVFAADDASRVWCHDALTGEIRWSYSSLSQPYKGIVQRLQYVDDSVVFGCYDGTVTRLDAGTGAVRWRWRQDSSVHATPIVCRTAGRVFVNTEQWNGGHPYGHVQAIDWESGRQIWSTPQRYWPPATVAYDIESNSVIAPCNDRTVACLDSRDGEIRWRVSTKGLVRGRPAISHGGVVWATEDGWLSCIDMLSGTVRWERRYGKPLAFQSLLVRDAGIYVLDGKWHMLVFDINSGELRWMSRLRSPGCGSALEYGKYVLVLSRHGELAVFDPALERKVWEGIIGGEHRQPPSCHEGLLAVASNDLGLKLFAINEFYGR